MKKRIYLLLVIGLLGLGAKNDKKLTSEEIIDRFAAKETEFKTVWQKYTYTQNILIEVLDRSGNPREQREIELEVYFTIDGKRETRILEDRGALRSVGVTKEDLDDAVHLQPFVLTKEEIPNYKIKSRGEEWVDEIYTYVFDVKPREIEPGKRYFKGRIWVDGLDFQIVKTRGKAVPDYQNNKFPEFEMVRQQVDGKHWFPVWVKADDFLAFGSPFNGRRIHIREWITLSNFKKFEVDTSIRFEPTQP